MAEWVKRSKPLMGDSGETSGSQTNAGHYVLLQHTKANRARKENKYQHFVLLLPFQIKTEDTHITFACLLLYLFSFSHYCFIVFPYYCNNYQKMKLWVLHLCIFVQSILKYWIIIKPMRVWLWLKVPKSIEIMEGWSRRGEEREKIASVTASA